MTSLPRRLAHPAAIATLACLLTAHTALAQSAGEHWVGTWSTADVVRPPARPPAPGQPQPAAININNQTLREVVHVSAGGARTRVVLSNAFGTEPLSIGAAQVA